MEVVNKWVVGILGEVRHYIVKWMTMWDKKLYISVWLINDIDNDSNDIKLSNRLIAANAKYGAKKEN